MIHVSADNDIPDLYIPKVQVKIIRRRSVADVNAKYQHLKLLLLPNSNKKSSIPKIQLSYQDIDQSCIAIRPNSSFNKHRPSTSPISVILKNQDVIPGSKNFKKFKARFPPVLARHKYNNSENLEIEGNSLKSYDWVSSFLNYSPDLKKSEDSGKISARKLASTPNKHKWHTLMRRRLAKGRCLIAH